MALNLKCPTCGSDNTQRLSIMKSQQTFTGSAGQTALAAHVQPPPRPWGFVIGFVVGLGVLGLLFAVSMWDRNPLPIVLAVMIWVGIGLWMRGPYLVKYREWERYLDAHFICLRCGALFKPGRDIAGSAPAVKQCMAPACARPIPRDTRVCPFCGIQQGPRLAKV
jgi:hypothetical protein